MLVIHVKAMTSGSATHVARSEVESMRSLCPPRNPHRKESERLAWVPLDRGDLAIASAPEIRAPPAVL